MSEEVNTGTTLGQSPLVLPEASVTDQRSTCQSPLLVAMAAPYRPPTRA